MKSVRRAAAVRDRHQRRAAFLFELDHEDISARTVNNHRQVFYGIFEYARRGDVRLALEPGRGTSKRPERDRTDRGVRARRNRGDRECGKGGPTPPPPTPDYSAETKPEWRRINEQDAALFIVAAYTGCGRESSEPCAGETSTSSQRS